MQRLVVVAERAAAALVMHRLYDRHRDSLIRRTHHELLLGLLNDPTDAEVLRRCELAGLPTTRRRFVGLTVRPLLDSKASEKDHSGIVEEVIASLVHLAHQARVPALACEIDQDVRVLLAFSPNSNHSRITDEIATRLRRRHSVMVCAGRAADRVSEIDRTLQEAQHVASSLPPGGDERAVHRLEDVHIRGLLTLLGDDERLRLFARRELDSLKSYDREHETDLLGALRAMLLHPVSKSDAAASLHLSRPAFYDRLAKIERLLGCSLDDPDIRVSLHVALLADELVPGPARSR